MKLKTGMVSHFPLMCNFDALKHDAAAAHALMQAIEEFWESPDGGGHEFDGVRCVQERADELMREWGFES